MQIPFVNIYLFNYSMQFCSITLQFTYCDYFFFFFFLIVFYCPMNMGTNNTYNNNVAFNNGMTNMM